jgi:hypothetical protein
MISFKSYITEQRRKASDIKSDEISMFIMNMKNLVNKYKRSQLKAAVIYDDIMMQGKMIDWLETNVEPIWEKYGYPEIGTPAWGQFQQEVIKKFLMGK